MGILWGPKDMVYNYMDPSGVVELWSLWSLLLNVVSRVWDCGFWSLGFRVQVWGVYPFKNSYSVMWEFRISSMLCGLIRHLFFLCSSLCVFLGIDPMHGFIPRAPNGPM